MDSPIAEKCKQKYTVDFEQKVSQILPYFWTFSIETGQRKQLFLNFMYVLFSQFDIVNISFVDFCIFIETRLSYTGQVLSLEKPLNDNFDNLQRRIFIECLDVPVFGFFDIYLDSETDPEPYIIFLDSESGIGNSILFTDAENESQPDSINFNVNVPNDIVETNEVIRGLLDIYIIANQNYNIIRF